MNYVLVDEFSDVVIEVSPWAILVAVADVELSEEMANNWSVDAVKAWAVDNRAVTRKVY